MTTGAKTSAPSTTTFHNTVIDAATVAAHLDAPGWILLDCRFDLADANAGWQAWGRSHIPGAFYAHLETDLSDMGKSGLGRHPLPEPEVFAAILGRFGIQPEHQVICYDAAGGALAAARAWWLLRTLGHEAVAVLDGGWDGWCQAGLPVDSGAVQHQAESYPLAWQADRYLLDAQALTTAAQEQGDLLIDARGAARFQGREEPIDAVAGHVPGAVNRPFGDNLVAGRFKPAAQLREEFLALLDGRQAGQVLHMCGSGVSAAHNILAMEHAGLSGSRLYAPSWSGWIIDPARPVARAGG
ncbi:MAG: sulfurtransferase [Xanthomonadales bacterium]|nr:sulfurtransferase [Xanthomonadales bacterium]